MSKLNDSVNKKVSKLFSTGKFPNEKTVKGFLAYIIDNLDIDIDDSIGSWLDSDDYWVEQKND